MENSAEEQVIAYFHQMSLEEQKDILLIAEMKITKRKRKKNNITLSLSKSKNAITELDGVPERVLKFIPTICRPTSHQILC